MPPRSSRRAVTGVNAGTDQVRQTIVETLEAPRLIGISTEDFVSFKQKREIYERRVNEKSAEQGVPIPATSYRNSIQNPILEMFVVAQWVPMSSVAEITEDNLKACVKHRSEIKPEDHDLAQIEKGIHKLSMDSTQKSHEMQVWRLGLDYATTLEDLGYSTFIATRPKLAIRHILKRITHDQLRKRIKLTLKIRKDELQSNYQSFMRETAKEAIFLDRNEAARSLEESDSDSDIDMKRSLVRFNRPQGSGSRKN